LCWLTVEQQFNPALEIVLAPAHHTMKTLITILFVLTFPQCICQNVVVTNSNFLYPVEISNIKKFNKDFDFQLRFWRHRGNTIPYSMDLFVMSQKNGKWSGEFYTLEEKRTKEFISLNKYKVIKHTIHTKDCDSIWKYFSDNKIVELPDMEKLRHQFFTQNTDGSISTIKVMDGETYTFEFITVNSYKRINYQCPQTYATEYTHIPELKYIVNIIKLIGQHIGKQNIPC